MAQTDSSFFIYHLSFIPHAERLGLGVFIPIVRTAVDDVGHCSVAIHATCRLHQCRGVNSTNHQFRYLICLSHVFSSIRLFHGTLLSIHYIDALRQTLHIDILADIQTLHGIYITLGIVPHGNAHDVSSLAVNLNKNLCLGCLHIRQHIIEIEIKPCKPSSSYCPWNTKTCCR